ncbi:MAG: glycosyltransferase [Phycisphaerae bacterium]|nr:glycosyltransferase [Phycisphaerae bacterium]
MIDPKAPNYANTPASDQRPSFGYALADPARPPLVSIVTPTFNTGELFRETVRTVLRQSFQQWEWLLVDDASDDPSGPELLRECAAGDQRIRIITHKQNDGPGAARNTGFAQARAEYVLIIDDDDLLEPTAIEYLYWYLESHPHHAFASTWEVGFGAKEYLWNLGFERGDKVLESNITGGRAMIRRAAHQAAGGYDATIRGGMEDWDFWLRLADQGLWGGTIPQYLNWYRTRDSHDDRWVDLDGAERQRAFRERLRQRFPRLYGGDFPSVERLPEASFEPLRRDIPPANILTKRRRRVLLILPWMTLGGADKFNLDLVEQLAQRDWDVTIVATTPGDNGWMPEFAKHTSDIFILGDFLPVHDYPAFLRYLIRSRRHDAVIVTGSEFGYLILPYLRQHCSEPAYVDYCHIEEEDWKSGGHPRHAVAYQHLLDFNGVTSEHLKQWMVNRGAAAEKIEVVYINVDSERWKPDANSRRHIRDQYDVAADTPLILYAGRLCEQKQPRVFARVMNALVERGLSFRTLIAGDGEDGEWLERYLKDHKLEPHVTMLGALPSEGVRELMAGSDIFFLPSRWEGVALSLFEALSMGLAVVGADVGGQRELVTPDCGILLPRADADVEINAYADVLEQLIRDPERRSRMGAAGRARIVTNFELSAMGTRMHDLLCRAIEAERPTAIADALRVDEWGQLAVEYTRASELLDQVWRNSQALKRDLEAAKEQVDELEEARDYFKQACEYQNAVVANLTEAREYFLDAMSGQRATIEKLEDAKTYFQKTIADIEQQRDALQATNQELREWTRTLHGRIDALDAQLVAQATELADRAARVNELVTYLERLRAQWWWRAGRRVAQLVGVGKELGPPPI